MLNDRGSSIIEVLVALVLTSIIFAGLVQSSLVSMNMNMKNLLRDEAISIAEDRVNEAKNLAFDALATEDEDYKRTIRGGNADSFIFNVQTIVIPHPGPTNPSNKQIDITVRWTWKGNTYQHAISTLVRRPETI